MLLIFTLGWTFFSSTGSELALSAKLATLRKQLEKCGALVLQVMLKERSKGRRNPQDNKIKKEINI